ncbi:TROVE domain-containing protein [Segniliparus rugosus]|uniref:TROVE domain-containing protein n=1 Tax=Segniliparus rugosus (strain ATCC BAA-974 / DSM 45345 / CCUG 50838 / CIP 108380 / JCM 13579 / CDC 945) TaxID=679197 RepID=E5XS43_SEGRC|nr:TROVE domain-containing protein [Segniliparus rugosus]EFV12828.2 hypothetical protein HMPREF9336_02315 [Segniliparus rugosus ATCC BAA-974]
MKLNPLRAISMRQAAQTQQADARQVRNAAGGYGFAVDDLARLRRFLTIGSDGGTYYAAERELTKDNAEIVLKLARERCAELVRTVVEVSASGRAPRQNPALFALAAASALGDETGRAAALAALGDVARTGTHLFLFAGYVEQFRGWGRGLRRAVGRWYLDAPVADLAYQIAKYRQREGWSHRDLLRLAHPATEEADRKVLFDFACGRAVDRLPDSLAILDGFRKAQAATTAGEWVSLIGQYPSLSWEMLPDAALNEASVWEALIAQGVPQTALMRQLPRLTRLGVLGSSGVLGAVAAQLADPQRLRKARVHPVNVLVAARTYAQGRGARSSAAWEPVAQIVDALDAAFYAAFESVVPTGKRTLLALDVSGSMTAPASGLPISCREVSAALALVTAKTEAECEVVGFTGGDWRSGTATLTRLAVSPRQRLDDALRAVSGLPFGPTDCALPMVWAQEQGLAFDVFQVYTDNETWFGQIHPHQALARYRERSGIDARLAVVALTATGTSIADPADPGQLDVSGFDSATPTVLAEWARGAWG